VLSDFGPDAFTASGTGGDQSRLSFSGNATALRSGTYYLGVFGTGTGGCSFTVVANSNRTLAILSLVFVAVVWREFEMLMTCGEQSPTSPRWRWTST
jgi:hypothetical protein